MDNYFGKFRKFSEDGQKNSKFTGGRHDFVLNLDKSDAVGQNIDCFGQNVRNWTKNIQNMDKSLDPKYNELGQN